MSKKGIVCYVVAILLFILYLVRANDIILYFDKDSVPQKVVFSEFQSNSEVYVCLDSCENIGGMLEKVYFQGWAFCETDYDNQGKKINLIFKSEDSDLCYKVDCEAQLRNDVYGAFRAEQRIYNGMAGVECQFSTIGIEEGTYQFYVQVIENEYNYGLKDTGYVLCKTGDKFEFADNQ